MEIREQSQSGTLILEPMGRLDSVSCRAFETQLLAALDRSGTVVVNCADLEYVSSAGLRVLLIAAKHSRGSGQLMLAALRENVREVFDISGFSTIFAIHPTVAAALAALAA